MKDGVHDSGSEQDFAIRNGQGSILTDRTVEGFNQILYAGIHMEVPSQEQSYVSEEVSEMLFRKQHWGNEVVGVTLEFRAPKPEHDFVILIENETILWAVDAKLVKQRAHL